MRTGHNNNPFILCAIVIICTLVFSCNSGSGEEDECKIDHDCDLPLVCRDGQCVPDDEPDGDRECESNFDCSGRLVCDKEQGKCVDPGEDGDAEVDEDLSDGDEDGDLEVELDEDTDGDEDIDGDEDLTDIDVEDEDDVEEEPIKIQFLSPVADRAVDGSVKIELSIETDFAIEKVEIAPYGSDMVTLTNTPWVVFWDTADIEEVDLAEIRVVVYAGELIVSARINVAIDHSNPTVEILLPEEMQVLGYNDTVKVKLDAKDHISKVFVFVDNNLYQTYETIEMDNEGYLNYEYAVSDFTKGEHDLMVRVEDQTGSHNQGGDASKFVIDDIAPDLIIPHVKWDDTDPDKGVLFAESPLSISFEDISGLKSASVTVKKNASTLLELNEVTDFPFVEENINDLLARNSEMYPAVFTIIASAVDNMDNETDVITKEITIKRVKWEFDPLTLNDSFEPPSSYEQKTGAAQSENNSNLYVTLYDEFHALSVDGEHQWSCKADRPFVTTPVVAEIDGLAPVAIAVTSNGTMYFHIDDGQAEDCIEFRPGQDDTKNAALTSPAPPAIEKMEAIPSGFKLTFIICANDVANTMCYKYAYTHTDNAKFASDEFSNPPLWSKQITGAVNPTSMLAPQPAAGTSAYLNPTVAVENKIMQLALGSGYANPVESINVGDNINNIFAIPSLPGIGVVSDKTLRLYGDGLANLNSQYSLSTGTVGCPYPTTQVDELLADQQPVSTSSGTIFIALAKCENNSYTSMIEAWDIDSLALSTSRWTFYPQGLSGGSSAIGEGDMLYVVGSNNYGNVWAVDIYNEDEITPNPHAFSNNEINATWQLRLNTPINAPLLISYQGDLVIVGKDNKVRVLDIHGSANPSAEDAWPMYQGAPDRKGSFYPN